MLVSSSFLAQETTFGWDAMTKLAAVIFALTALAAATVAEGRSVVTHSMPRDPTRPSRFAWEPGMSRGPDGAIWVVGNHCALVDQHGACEVNPAALGFEPDYTPLWRSTDRGRTYRWVADPLRAVESRAALPGPLGALAQDHPGGYDTDVAVAPARRPGRPALVYVVSAWEGSSTLSVSADNGRTWATSSLTGVPVQDRPWLAASGACDLFMQYHPLTGAQDIASVARVDRYDGCALAAHAAAGQTSAAPLSSTLVEPATDEATATNSVMAKIVAIGGRVYVAYLACAAAGADSNCDAPGNRQTLHVAVSRDEARTFSDLTLPDAGLHGPLNDGVWPIAMDADPRGDVAVATTDTRHVHLWTSTNAGRSWRLRRSPVDASSHGYATVPSVAVRGPRLVVAWYGSGPAARSGPQRWRLVVARSEDRGARFPRHSLEPVLATTAHEEPLGDALYDDFGLLFLPRGEVALSYTQLCDGHPVSDPLCPGAGAAEQTHALVVRSAWLAGPRKRHARH
jgi:hypothetical protein